MQQTTEPTSIQDRTRSLGLEINSAGKHTKLWSLSVEQVLRLTGRSERNTFVGQQLANTDSVCVCVCMCVCVCVRVRARFFFFFHLLFDSAW